MSELTGDSGPNALQQFTDKTAFGVNEKFDAVDNNSEMATAQFLKACVDITSILDRLGTGFSVPKKDIVGNIKRIDEKFKSNPEKYSTLKVIIQDEAQVQAKSSKITSLAAALIWLRRALSFLLSFISLLSKEYHAGVGEQNLRQTVVTAYQGTLKPFHGRMTQFLFSNVARLTPYRKDFLAALMTADDATVEMVISDIDHFLPNFSANIDRLEALLVEHHLNVEDKVS